MIPKYIDIHSHLQFPQYDEDRTEVLARMQQEGVWTFTVGTNLKTSKEAVSFAKEHEGVLATVGLHPNDTDKEEFNEQAFDALLEGEKIVAIGECGLDYYRIRNDESGIKEIKKRQEEAFVGQIEFALKHDKPLMLHCRPSKGTMDAYEDVLAILRSYFEIHNSKLRGNVHFFVGNVEIAKGFLELGFTMSFTGVLTFARDYDEVVRFLPLESILTETDAPFAAPVPYRGKRNEPTYVIEVIKAIASIRGVSEEEARQGVAHNTIRAFHLDAQSVAKQ